MNQAFARLKFDGSTIVASYPSGMVSLHCDELQDIGIETTGGGDPHIFLVINRFTHNVRFPEIAPAFKGLLDYFASLSSFNWHALVEAKKCASPAYFLCWVRPTPLPAGAAAP